MPRQLPAATDFTGRAAELATLTELSRPGGATLVVSAAAGLAGAGKTALAVYWAHQAAGQFPEASSTSTCAATIPASRCGPPTRWPAFCAAWAWPARTSRPIRMTGRPAATLIGYLDTGNHFPEAVTVCACARQAAREAGDRDAEATALSGLALGLYRKTGTPEAEEVRAQFATLRPGPPGRSGRLA